MAWDRVWVDANVATMTPGGAPYGTLRDAAVAIVGDRIAWIGSSAEGRARAAESGAGVESVGGRWITPGLVDCHTHLVYGGNRVAEFEQRLLGASYEEIARAGGGIQSTVNATRSAAAALLFESAALRARRLMAEGVTTLEIKSGYGLEFATERRCLETARELGRRLPVTVRTTFLGLHALPKERAAQRAQYVADASGPWLAQLVEAGLVDAVDAFCENIAFSLDETEVFLKAAQALGLPAHLHAGQLTDMGGAELAARYGALSADHLEYLSAAGATAMAKARTVAVMLPGAYYTLRQSTPPPVPLLRSAGVEMAVASDSNPGTSPLTSMLLSLNMACTLFGLTPEEALAGATRIGARALGLGAEIGTLEQGKRADFAIWEIDRPAELSYALGANPCIDVLFGGVSRNGMTAAAG